MFQGFGCLGVWDQELIRVSRFRVTARASGLCSGSLELKFGMRFNLQVPLES